MNLKKTLFFLLFIVFPTFAMESKFKTVKSWRNAKRFAGSVVAYKCRTDLYCFRVNKGYPIDSDESIKYGYIAREYTDWSSGEKGYNMTRLLRPKGVPGNCALTDSDLGKDGALLLRRITEGEHEQIEGAVKSGKAEFEYVDKKQALAMLAGEEEAYWKKRRSLLWGQSGSSSASSSESSSELSLESYSESSSESSN